MQNLTKSISTDLFYKIRSRFTGLTLGDANGQVTIVPEEAVFFDFDYIDNDAPVGHVSISIAEQGNMKVYYSENITETMDSMQKNNWYDFLRELRTFAKRRLLSFDTRDITKDTLDKTDFQFLSQNTQVGESIMSEAAMYGTKKTSFQKLENTRLIIKHSQALPEEMKPGARSRNISALFIENAEGERFKYPFIHLAGARAMQRHVANGGLPYDDVGKSIVQMSEEIAQLKSFGNYVVKNDLMNGNNGHIVERSQAQLNNLREILAKLAKQGHYEAYKESFQAVNQVEVPEEVIEDFTEKFTVKNFKEDIKSVFPVLYRLMQEENEVGYNDIVDMTTTKTNTEEVDLDEEIEITDFDKFENWVMSLGESSPIQSDNEEEQMAAVRELQELVGSTFPAGTGGTNAIMSLKGIINDPELQKEIKEQSKEDANFDVRGLVQSWLDQNAPGVLEKLDFGDFESQQDVDQATAEPEQVPQEARKEDNEKEGQLNIKELAEFIHSFYDKETNCFPKGPEGIATMVGKKFGEQAEKIARHLVEKMAPHQTTEQNPELAELARIKELAGMQNEAGGHDTNQHSQTKDFGSVVEYEEGDDFDQENPPLDMTGQEYYEATGSKDMMIPTIIKTLGLPDSAMKIMYFDDADLVFNEKTVANLNDTIGDMAEKTKAFMDQNPKYVARSMKEGTTEEDAGDIKSTVTDMFEKMLADAKSGMDVTDNIADELGDHFDEVRNSGDENLIKAYAFVREELADTDPEEQAQGLMKAIQMLKGKEESINYELENIRRLSGIAQGINF